MPQSPKLSEDILAWLSSDKCVPWLMQQARHLLVRLYEIKLPPDIWPYGDPRQMEDEERATAVAEAAHEFWLFARGFFTEGRAKLPAEASPASGRGLGLFGAYLRGAYLNGLRSKARKKSVSPRRHLYRRLRETLSKSPGFYYLAQKEWTYYSMQDAAPISDMRIAQFQGGYQDWPSPCEMVSESQLSKFKSKQLCLVAELFWKEATVRLAGPHYLPIWELVAFFIEHYGLFHDGGHMPTEYSENIAAGGLRILSPDKGGLQLLAAQLVSSWSPRRRMVFVLAMDGAELTYQEIAERAGLSGPSHAKYHLDSACRELADFCETWPGLTPPPTERAFWTEFLILTADVCKNSLQGRPIKTNEPQPEVKDAS